MALSLTPKTKEILFQARKIIPPLLEKFHKGQMGRVAVIGGCEDYTGAPFFSANASALLGADLSHIICEPNAAGVIKTYSPNLMVHPYMLQSNHLPPDSKENAESLSKRIIGMLDRLHVIVVGPGLGRDELMLKTAGIVVKEARERGMGIVIDADGLLLISSTPSLIRNYKNAILTPNVVEFSRLCKALNVDSSTSPTTACARLAKELGGVTIIQKGKQDTISNGTDTITCDVPGGLKRSGGQGDTLTGCLGTFLAWKKAYKEGLWNDDDDDIVGSESGDGKKLGEEELMRLVAFAGSAVTRTCSSLAFKERGRAMQASDLQGHIQRAFQMLFEDGQGEGEKGARL
ncbi:hypothetical protein TWF679_009915 [Orbilia oligospora]|uniref:ATP-dependent (S)-NAD(P)H-hydrate dehydratase n=1 Tax=Orbilia oligospora TaxID=2813651 RepID=A0A8H8V1J0_ORBOL|nr:hypothetical protein TWF679_009915 [Orbilia oligospora]